MSATMDKDAIRAAMDEAGLLRPRVMLVRLRDGSHVFDLYAGPPDQRRIERVRAAAGLPTTADADEVAAMIDVMTPLE